MVLQALKVSLGRVELQDITRERLIEFGRKRAAQGAGPATLAIDFAFIRAILTHAAAVHGIKVSIESVQLARAALKHLDLIGKSNERDRRPTQDELNRLIEYVETNRQRFIPLGRIIRFAVATAMRQAEICRIEWSDVDMKKRTVSIRDRKDPRRKDGNHQIVPSAQPASGSKRRSRILAIESVSLVTADIGEPSSADRVCCGPLHRAVCESLFARSAHIPRLRGDISVRALPTSRRDHPSAAVQFTSRAVRRSRRVVITTIPYSWRTIAINRGNAERPGLPSQMKQGTSALP
jgi:integrase